MLNERHENQLEMLKAGAYRAVCEFALREAVWIKSRESAAATWKIAACDGVLDLETEWRELDALPVVNTVRNDLVEDRARRTSLDRVICTLYGAARAIRLETFASPPSSATRATCQRSSMLFEPHE